MMHRSNNVRSARNVWSIPTGEHEIGESVIECASRELMEEYGLALEAIQLLDQYENIAGDADAKEQYHWVLTLFMVRVGDVTKAINKEPEKHDKMEFIPYQTLAEPDFLERYRFHDSLQSRMMINIPTYVENIRWFLHPEPETYDQFIKEESITAGASGEFTLVNPTPPAKDQDTLSLL